MTVSINFSPKPRARQIVHSKKWSVVKSTETESYIGGYFKKWSSDAIRKMSRENILFLSAQNLQLESQLENESEERIEKPMMDDDKSKPPPEKEPDPAKGKPEPAKQIPDPVEREHTVEDPQKSGKQTITSKPDSKESNTAKSDDSKSSINLNQTNSSAPKRPRIIKAKQMKTKMILKFIPVGMILFILTGCQKYEDGPMFSIRTRTERVANTWEIDNYSINSTDVTSLFGGYSETFSKDGNYSYTYGVFNGTGTWKFSNKQSDITLTGISNQQDRVFVLLKLEEEQMWYYYMDGDDRHELHLTEK